MILVIEDDEGAAWTICEGVENFNLETEEGKDSLISAVSNTLQEIHEETEGYSHECDDEIMPIIDVDEEGRPVLNNSKLGYSDDLLEEDPAVTDAMADELPF